MKTPAVADLLQRHHCLMREPRWQRSLERDGVVGELLPTAAPEPWAVRCTTTVGCAPPQLARFLVDDIVQTLRDWNPVFGGGEVVATMGEGQRVLRLINRLPWPLRAREDLFFNAKVLEEAGRIIEVSAGIDDADHPPAAGMLRSGLHFASKQFDPHADGCRYTAIWHYDLRGLLPRLLPRKTLATAVLRDMAKECDRLRKRFGAG